MKKIAILNAGLDKIRRGYETHSRLLFDSMIKEKKDGYSFTLFKNNGKKNNNEIVLDSPFRYGIICSYLGRIRGNHLYWESLFFSIYFIIYANVKRLKYDSIIVIEPMVSKTLYKFKKILPGNPKIVFTHGVTNSPEEIYYTADIIHQVNIENYNSFKKYISENSLVDKQILIPHFLGDNYQQLDENKLKQEYNIKTSKVILSVGAIENVQKRMGYVIDEFQNLDDNWTLLIAGVVSDKKLYNKAKSLFDDRFINVQLPNSKMNELYQLSDVLVVASLNEGFGIVTLEAMSNKLPVILHKRSLFECIIKGDTFLIDMENKDALFNFINDLEKGCLTDESKRQYEVYQNNYTWESVKNKYYSLI